MMRLGMFLWGGAAVVASIGLYLVEGRVRALEGDLSTLNRGILRNREAIHVLEADWSLMNDPERLSALADDHLDLVPATPGQFASFDDVPMRIPGLAPAPMLSSLEPDATAVLAAMRSSQ
jgi:hypothetical protein